MGKVFFEGKQAQRSVILTQKTDKMAKPDFGMFIAETNSEDPRQMQTGLMTIKD